MNTGFQLVAFQAADIGLLLQWVPSERALLQWAGPTMFSWPLNGQQLNKYFARTTGNKPTVLIHKLINSNDNQAMGIVELDKVDYEKGIAVLSRVIVDPELRGKGYGAVLVEKALSYAFNFLELKEIQLSVYSFNKSAVSCYEKAGFKVTEMVKNCCNIDDEIWDSYKMSLIAGDFCKQ